MDLDAIDNRQKKEGREQQADSHYGGTAGADATTGSMGCSLTDQTDRAAWGPFKRYAYQEITGGYGFAVACLLVAFLLRWLLDVYLNDEFPYATFIPASIIIAVFCRIPATVIAVVLGGFLSNWFFVTPRHELNFTGLRIQAEMAIYFTISFAAIGLIQTWRWAWRTTETMAKELRYQANSKSSTKE